MYLLVLRGLHHQGKLQLVQPGLGHWHADEAAGVVHHESDRLRGDLQGRQQSWKNEDYKFAAPEP